MALRAACLVEAGLGAAASKCCDTIDSQASLFEGYLPLVWLWQWTARCSLALLVASRHRGKRKGRPGQAIGPAR
ncbi:MAG: hypothetical protein ACYCTL_11535 [Acidimicrobiales bacterium]